MKPRFLLFVKVALPSIFFFLPTALHGQLPDPLGMPGSHQITDSTMYAFSGKVQFEGGADAPKDTVVALECGSVERGMTHTDSRGRFMLVIDETRQQRGFGGLDWNPAESSLGNCNLRVSATGFKSEERNLAGEHPSGVAPVGTIVMHPLTRGDESFTVNAASLAAPDKAKKQFQKGQEQAKKGKWAAAGDYFRKAVQVYPRYALAWLELGRAQMQQNNFMEAQDSFQKAAAQDSRLLPAYLELARVQARAKEWKALAATTAKLVELAPESSAMLWFFDSVANYNVHDFTRAESSATRGLRLDSAHKVPQLEYLYGLILATRQNYDGAVQHIQSYIQLAPHAEDAQAAREKLAELQQQATKTAGAGQP